MNPTSAVAYFCEDIRTEEGGRYTLIGIYPDNIAISDPPGPVPEGQPKGLPKLSVFARINFDPRQAIGPITSKLINSDGSEMDLGPADPKAIEAAASSAIQNGGPLAGVNVLFQSSPFLITAPGRILFEITIGKEKFIAGGLKVSFLPKA